jgi:hypothetical protein
MQLSLPIGICSYMVFILVNYKNTEYAVEFYEQSNLFQTAVHALRDILWEDCCLA